LSGLGKYETTIFGNAFIAYKYGKRDGLLYLLYGGLIVDGRYCGLFNEKMGSIIINVHSWFEQCNTADKWFSDGGIYISKIYPVIPLPEKFIQERNNLFQKAQAGTIFDILEYENLYKSGDDNMVVLKPRKTEMLYSAKFFDNESEKYKNNLYEQKIKEADSFIQSNRVRDKNLLSETEINGLDSILKPLHLYAQNGYDPRQYVQSIFIDYPMEHIDNLVEFQKLVSQRYTFW
jgi:hypothetical protein